MNSIGTAWMALGQSKEATSFSWLLWEEVPEEVEVGTGTASHTHVRGLLVSICWLRCDSWPSGQTRCLKDVAGWMVTMAEGDFLQSSGFLPQTALTSITCSCWEWEGALSLGRCWYLEGFHLEVRVKKPRDPKVALESSNNCKVSKVRLLNKSVPSKGKSSMVCVPLLGFLKLSSLYQLWPRTHLEYQKHP